MHRLFVLTGVHGSGKTSAARELVSRLTDDRLAVYFPDEVPPSEDEELIDSVGGTDDQAQRRKIVEWVRRIKHNDLQFRSVLLVMMCWPTHLQEACMRADHRGPKMVLFDCTDTARRQRLTGPRKAPGLATVSTYNKAAHLFRECTRSHAEIIDTSMLSVEACADILDEMILGQAEPVARLRQDGSAYAQDKTGSTEDAGNLLGTRDVDVPAESKDDAGKSAASLNYFADPFQRS